jgi:arginine/lysine/ornithine decarboxylase
VITHSLHLTDIAANVSPRKRHASFQHRAPIVEALDRVRSSGTVAFSTPGHKGGLAVDEQFRALVGADFLSADIWLNTTDLDAIQRDAESLAAHAWGADRTFFLTNGSSAGNHAALLALLNPGDEVIVSRDVHTSLLTALVLTGATPVYVAPRVHPGFDVALGPDPGAVADALDAHPAARLVVLTSPSYWGVAAETDAIAAVAHLRDVPLYVDEAWGPHLAFHPMLPRSAMASGADVAVTSPHKLLNGVSQAAILNARGPRIDMGRLAATVRMGQTTSPLMPILASLDACRRQMAMDGQHMLDRALGLAQDARDRIGAIPGLAVVDGARLGLPPDRYDATRLVIDVQRLGITGFEAERNLRERFSVAVEMSDLIGIVCLVTVSDTAARIDRLVTALATIAGERDPGAVVLVTPTRSAGAVTAPGEQVLTPREAFFAPMRAVPLAAAVGEIAAELVVPYPPGIPVLAPGERISAEKITYLAEVARRGGCVRGAADPRLATIRVVDATAGTIAPA